MRTRVRRVGVVLALMAVSACEDASPAVDAAVIRDLAAPGASGDLALTRLVALTAALDTQTFSSGVTARLDNYPGTESQSDGGGKIILPIPRAACGQSVDLVIGGMTAGFAVLPSLRAPPLLPTCAGELYVPVVHVVLDDPGVKGVRTTVARELAGHGDISASEGASGAAFAAQYSWIIGRFLAFLPEEHGFSGGTITIDGGEGRCHLYYTERYRNYYTGLAPRFIDFGAATSPGGFIVVCPVNVAAPLTLTATGFSDASDGTPAQFSSITVSPRPDRMISVDWEPGGP